MEMNKPILEVKNLKKYFIKRKGLLGQKIQYIKAVDDISFEVKKGETFGLVGESGCGKTTAGRSIIKLYDITDGQVYFNNQIVSSGTFSYVNKIKDLKAQTKFDILKANPFAFKKYEIINNSKKELDSIEKEIDDINRTSKEEIVKLFKPIVDFNKFKANINLETKLEIDDIINLNNQKIRNAERTKKAEINNEANNEIVNFRYTANRDINKLKSQSPLSKTKLAKVKILTELKNNISRVKLETKNKIEEDKLALLSKEEVKKLKIEVKKTILEKTAILNSELEKKINEAKKNLPDITVLENKKVDIIKNQNIAIEKLKQRKLEANNNEKKQITDLIEDKKSNPQNYAIDKETILNIKEQLTKDIKEQKKIISQAKVDDKIKAKFRKSMQMIFQDPYASLNSRMTVSDIISEPIRIHNLLPQEKIKDRVNELLNMVGLSKEHASRYPHEFSGGQRQRIGIARALAVNPEFIICDEPISALDVSIQAQVINLLEELQDKLGLTYVFIAHDLSVVKHISDRIAVMYLGKIVEVTTSSELFKNPLHPYTKALLSAVPVPSVNKGDKIEQIILEGDLPSPINPPSGCRFRTRCQFAHERCKNEEPKLQDMGNKHIVSCHLLN